MMSLSGEALLDLKQPSFTKWYELRQVKEFVFLYVFEIENRNGARCNQSQAL